MNYKELEDKIYKYPTKYEEGFTQKEIEEVLKDYPDISRKHFDDAMTGNTCQAKIEGEQWIIINYHCDVLKALTAGLEKRNLSMWEWD